MLFHQINDWLCTGLSGCESIRQRLPPLVGILACLIPGGIMCCLLSQIRGWRPVLLSGALTVMTSLLMYVRLSAVHWPQGDAAMAGLFSGFSLIMSLSFEAMFMRIYPHLRYGLRMMTPVLSVLTTFVLWLHAGVRI